MKILLVGSSGLVGKALRRYLLQEGQEVFRLLRYYEQWEDDMLIWDPEEGAVDGKKLEGFDAVINLAGENIANGRWNEEKKKRILESRVKTTRLLADTLAHLDRPPKVWINASATGYYGNRGDLQVDEETPSGEGFLARVCREWEEATESAKKAGIRVVIARLGIVLAPKGGMLERVLFPFKWGLGGMIGDGGQYMSWITINDLVHAFLHLLKTDSLKGPVIVTTPNPVSNYAFTKTLGSVLSRPTLLPLPAFAAKLAFGKEMAEEMLLTSVNACPKKLIDSGFVFHYPKLDQALRYLLEK